MTNLLDRWQHFYVSATTLLTPVLAYPALNRNVQYGWLTCPSCIVCYVMASRKLLFLGIDQKYVGKCLTTGLGGEIGEENTEVQFQDTK